MHLKHLTGLHSLVRGAALAAVLALSTIHSPELSAQAPAQSEKMLVGAHWTTKAGADTLLALTNPKGFQGTLRLVLYADNGNKIAEKEFDYGSINQMSFSLGSLAGPGRSGYLKLHCPSDVSILPAQLLVLDGPGTPVNALVAEGLIGHNARNRHAIVPPYGGRQLNFVSLVNVGEEVESGTLRVDGPGAGAVHWRLAPGHARTISLPSDSTFNSPALITLDTESDDPRIVFSGISRSMEKGSAALNFHSVKLAGTGEISGFYYGSDSALVLANLSGRAAPLALKAIDGTGAVRESEAELPAGVASVLPFRELLGLPAGDRGSISVAFAPDLTVFGDVVNMDTDMTVNRMKDTAKETFTAYSFPVHIGPDLETVIRLFNPNDRGAIVCVFLVFGEHRYSHALKWLEARQFAEVDVKALRDDRTPDEFGNALPEDATDGQAIVVFHDESRHKLVANAFLSDTRTGATAVFGCNVCPPEDVGIDLMPNTISGTVGSQQSVSVMAFFSYGLPKWVTGSCQYTSYDTAVASKPSSSNGFKVGFVGPGTTILEADFFGCRRYSEFYNYEEGIECQCVETVTEQDLSLVNSKPKITSVSLSTLKFGTNSNVVLTGTGFKSNSTITVSGTGVTATVNSATTTSITATFTVASSATAGSRTMTVTSAAQTSAPFGISVIQPHHLVVVSDNQAVITGGCTPPALAPIARVITLRAVDSAGAPVGVIDMAEHYNSLTTNTCGNGQPSPSGCGPTNSNSEEQDGISVNCNTTGGSCGYTINWSWQWCGPGTQRTTLGTLSGVVHHNAITVNGQTMPPSTNRIPAGTAIFP